MYGLKQILDICMENFKVKLFQIIERWHSFEDGLKRKCHINWGKENNIIRKKAPQSMQQSLKY